MKKIVYITISLMCVLSILFGHMHWNSKIEEAGIRAQAENDINAGNEDKGTESSRSAKLSEQKEEVNIDVLTSNLSEEMKTKIADAVENSEPVQFSIVGSGDINSESSWSSLFVKSISDAYGKDVFNFNIVGLGETLSTEAHQSSEIEKVVESMPDIVLLEPMIWNDNGDVTINDTLDSISIIERKLKENNQELILFLQPAHPIYQPGYYQNQVDALSQYAEEQGITYLNHWENWPDVSEEDIWNFIEKDMEAPNEEGHKRWAQYLTNYFTGK